MYKNLFIAAAAVAVLASCTKNEVNPVSVPEKEISYQAVVGPKTKGLTPSQSSFSTENVFVSYGYRLMGSDKNWANDKAEAELYIDGATIGYQSGEGASTGVWRSVGNDRYYWPNNGSVTFFAWSNNKKKDDVNATSLVAGTVSCTKENGIKVEGYNARSNKNYDFMVADIAADKNSNENTYEYTGVPTLFRHKLCQVKYSVKTDVTYTLTKFWINSLAFNNIYQTADYRQYNTDSWTPTGSKISSVPYSSASYTEALTTEIYPSTGHWTDGSNDQFYFIPQAFGDDAILEITYTIKTGDAEETQLTKSIKLKNLFPDGWVKNKIYTINISLGLKEILWDPAVENWDTDVNVDWPLIDSGSTVGAGA